jgi:hypothetical protein
MNQDDCQLGDILAEYIVPIMQVLTNELPEYNMKLKVTKCLNVAIMLTIFILGLQKGKRIIDNCDSRKTKSEEYYIKNKDILVKDLDNVLKKEPGKYLYYILLADAEFKNDGYISYFPGHVFLIEKYNNNYKLYQSYIKQYDLQEYKDKVSTFKIDKEKIKNIIKYLKYIILEAKTWDDKCVKYWNNFTLVDTTNIKGADIKNNMHICILKSKVDSCLENLKTYLTNKINSIEDIDTIYGNIDIYDIEKNPKKILTSKEIKQSLNSMLEKIKHV